MIADSNVGGGILRGGGVRRRRSLFGSVSSVEGFGCVGIGGGRLKLNVGCAMKSS